MQQIKAVGGTIIIEDNGIGMTQSQFSNTWMRIATIDKELNPISIKYGRQKAGEKGIGRFACRRLSSTLELESIAELENGEKQRLRAYFNWSTFMAGSDVNRIPVSLSEEAIESNTPTGTTLRLTHTTETWNAVDLRQLKYELTDLISPGTFNDDLDTQPEIYDPGFKVYIECLEFPVEVEPLDQSFFKNAWAKLSGIVGNDGIATYHLQTTQGLKLKVDKEYIREEAFKYLRDTELEAYIFSYRQDFFRNSDWRMSQSQKVGEERGGIKVYADKFRVFGYGTKGDDWLGVTYDRARSAASLSHEFNKYVDEDVRPGLSLFRNNNLFGHVVFSRASNEMLEITVNRDRITSSDAFEELRRFVRLGIDFATIFYANQVDKEQKEAKDRKQAREEARAKAAAAAREREEKARREAKEEARKAEVEEKRLEEEVFTAVFKATTASEKRRATEQARREAEEKRRNIEEQIRHTGASTALNAAFELALAKELELVGDEETAVEEEKLLLEKSKNIETKAKEAIEAAIKEAKKTDEENRIAEDTRRKAEEDELRIKQEKLQKEWSLLRVLASTGTLILIFEHELQALIDDMEDMISSVSTVRSNMRDNEQESFQIVFDSFSNRTEMVKELGEFLGITMGAESRFEKRDWVVSPIIDQVFRPFKWYLNNSGIEHNNQVPDDLRTPRMYRSELVSVLHNLMTNAVKAVTGTAKRQIEVTGIKDEGNIRIHFLDTGKGLDKSRWEAVFEPFESDSEPDIKFGVGTGLGLMIVRDIIRSYGGEVNFCDAPDGWATCVEIMLPSEE